MSESEEAAGRRVVLRTLEVRCELCEGALLQIRREIEEARGGMVARIAEILDRHLEGNTKLERRPCP